jgi:hypothetical protein
VGQPKWPPHSTDVAAPCRPHARGPRLGAHFPGSNSRDCATANRTLRIERLAAEFAGHAVQAAPVRRSSECQCRFSCGPVPYERWRSDRLPPIAFRDATRRRLRRLAGHQDSETVTTTRLRQVGSENGEGDGFLNRPDIHADRDALTFSRGNVGRRPAEMRRAPRKRYSIMSFRMCLNRYARSEPGRFPHRASKRHPPHP